MHICGSRLRSLILGRAQTCNARVQQRTILEEARGDFFGSLSRIKSWVLTSPFMIHPTLPTTIRGLGVPSPSMKGMNCMHSL